jgi:exoribonuclease R
MSRRDLANREQLRAIAHRAMLQRGLLPDFSPAALAQTEAITRAATEADPSIRDLRGLLWCSIDNDESRDLDQLSVTAPMSDGLVKMLVAAADVDALVQEGSAAVYTAAEVFPMLPEKLSTDLTSLGEGQERLALVIEMGVGGDGTVARSDVYRALVRNRAKLAYDGVAAWLEGTAPAPPRRAAAEVDRVGPSYLYPKQAAASGFVNPAVTQANIQQTICAAGWTDTIRPSSSYTTVQFLCSP